MAAVQKPRPTLTLAPGGGLLVQHVEALLAWRRSSCEKNEKEDKAAKIKELKQSTLLFIFVTAAVRWKNNKPQNYDECRHKGEELILTFGFIPESRADQIQSHFLQAPSEFLC